MTEERRSFKMSSAIDCDCKIIYCQEAELNTKNTKRGQEMIPRLAEQIDQMVSCYKELDLLLLTEPNFNLSGD